MSAAPTVLVCRDPDVLAEAVAARLVTRLVDAQAGGTGASVVLAGGGIGIAALAAVAASPARLAVRWSDLDVWWGDERFVELGSEDRNDGQARAALLDHVDVDEARVHPMGWLGGPDGDDVDQAAARYAAELAAAAAPGATVPVFDVLVLGMGPEGHTASIFPESPAASDDRAAFAVRDCPKPPPTRISLGFSALCSAREVWMVASGEGKAEAVARALSGADRLQVPAAGPRGTERTLWLLDEAAASQLPQDLRRP